MIFYRPTEDGRAVDMAHDRRGKYANYEPFRGPAGLHLRATLLLAGHKTVILDDVAVRVLRGH